MELLNFGFAFKNEKICQLPQLLCYHLPASDELFFFFTYGESN